MAPSKNKKKSFNKNPKSKGKNGDKQKKRPRVKEIVFDPEARRDYLRGFSERKRQRRAYGLAMQKVKDRKAKLAERKEMKEAQLEQIEEAERLKEQVKQDALKAVNQKEAENKEEDKDDKDNNSDSDSDTEGDTKQDNHSKDKITTTYHDKATQQQWGGDVVVTTSMNLCDSDDSDDEKEHKPKKNQPRTATKKSRDTEQEYAGKVEKFLTQFKQKMPAKKKQVAAAQKHKGKHGAAAMKGIGSATEMKIAQKALSRTKGGGKSGKKGKR